MLDFMNKLSMILTCTLLLMVIFDIAFMNKFSKSKIPKFFKLAITILAIVMTMSWSITLWMYSKDLVLLIILVLGLTAISIQLFAMYTKNLYAAPPFRLDCPSCRNISFFLTPQDDFGTVECRKCNAVYTVDAANKKLVKQCKR